MTPRGIRESEASIREAALEVAELWALRRSKDPSTKVGAAIYDPPTGGLYLGYNGFPVGIEDREEWWQRRDDRNDRSERAGVEFALTKYDLVVHAEVNAVRKALYAGVKLSDTVLVVTHLPCPECMKNVIVANKIPEVVYAVEDYKSATERAVWVTKELAVLGGVALVQATHLTGEGAQYKVEG